MIGKEGEFLMPRAQTGKNSSAKWRSVKLVLMTCTVIILSIPVALLPLAIHRIQPTAEFVFLVVAPGLWNSVSTWITAPCLYVLLNILLVTLAFISRATPTSNHDQPHHSGIFNYRSSAEIESIEIKLDADFHYNNIIVESKLADPVDNNLSPAASTAQLQKPTAALIVESRSSSFKDLKAALTPAPALYAKESRLRRSTVKLSNLSKESRESSEMTVTKSCTLVAPAPKTSAPQMVVFEISTDVGDYNYMHQEHGLNVDDEVAMVEGDEECTMHHPQEDGKPLSAEELYVKAESFIGDFYRQLKMQREDSWNRLCSIYKQSC